MSPFRTVGEACNDNPAGRTPGEIFFQTMTVLAGRDTKQACRPVMLQACRDPQPV